MGRQRTLLYLIHKASLAFFIPKLFLYFFPWNKILWLRLFNTA